MVAMNAKIVGDNMPARNIEVPTLWVQGIREWTLASVLMLSSPRRVSPFWERPSRALPDPDFPRK
jgi:hypothetical protein